MAPQERTKPANRLIREKSPYLLQHATNPVDWHPWGEEAFRLAATLDRPLFLSIGYATCHWCHVMERESFEDPELARLLNETFVSVKVDREERPDIDAIYMTFCQMMTGSGGWPLTIIMTPAGEPFFAGTYFPPESRFGRIGLRELTRKMQTLWITQRDKVLAAAANAVGSLRDNESRQEATTIPPGLTEARALVRDLAAIYDEKEGGFGKAPKFPMAQTLLFLLAYGKKYGDEAALAMAARTLDAMASGGIRDHLGGGFHRYATDRQWLVPHFEKMLYDQALLALAYLKGYELLGEERYAQQATGILDYVARDLSDASGGFYCGEDADSDGEEGRFYLWELAEVRALLDHHESALFERIYGLRAEGNFHDRPDGGSVAGAREGAGATDRPDGGSVAGAREGAGATDETTGGKTGANVLHAAVSLEEAAGALGLSIDAGRACLVSAREKLLVSRHGRVRPHRDDKILTDWNGLMITAFARAGALLGRPDYLDRARRAADFILATLRVEGRLLHRYRDGEAAIPGFLDDYVFLVWGLLEIHAAGRSSATPGARDTSSIRSVGGDGALTEAAISLTHTVDRYFRDDGSGGYFFTAADGETLLFRRKEYHDGALPTGNGVHYANLQRLAGITGDKTFAVRAQQLAAAMGATARTSPIATAFLLTSLIL